MAASSMRLARWIRQWAVAAASTRAHSTAVRASISRHHFSIRASSSAGFSPGIMPWAVSPCVTPLYLEIDLPASVRGPVQRCAFLRLALILAWLLVGLALSVSVIVRLLTVRGLEGRG